MRILRSSDAPALAAAYVRNREYLSPWELVRPEEYYTEAWQASDIASRLVAEKAGEGYPLGLFADDSLVGRLTSQGSCAAPSRAPG